MLAFSLMIAPTPLRIVRHSHPAILIRTDCRTGHSFHDARPTCMQMYIGVGQSTGLDPDSMHAEPAPPRSPPALSSVILHACMYALVLCAPYAALSAAFCCCILRLFCTEGLCAQRHHGSARPPCGDAHAHAMSLAHLKGVPTLQPSGRCMLSSAVRSLEFSRSPTGDKVAVRCDTRTAHVTCQSARDAPCV